MCYNLPWTGAHCNKGSDLFNALVQACTAECPPSKTFRPCVEKAS